MVKRGNDFLKSIIGKKKQKKGTFLHTPIKIKTYKGSVHSFKHWMKYIKEKQKRERKKKKEGRIILSFHSSKKKESKADRFSLDIWLFCHFKKEIEFLKDKEGDSFTFTTSR